MRDNLLMGASSKLLVFNWQALSADYARHHTTRGNQICHSFGIPMIMLALIRWTLIPGTAIPVLAALLPVYFFWKASLGLAMLSETAAMAWLATFISGWAALALFAIGWILQMVGHKVFEKNNPAFLKSLIHLLVGPAWILSKWLSLRN